MLEAYKNYWIGFADFKGRTNVKGYWLAVLAQFLVSFILTFIVTFFGRYNPRYATLTYLWPFQILCVLPSLAIMVRRLSDAGYSWINVFWLFLPIAGAVLLIIRLCKPSVEPAMNEPDLRYGNRSSDDLNNWRIPSGLLLLYGTLILITPILYSGTYRYLEIFWWLSRLSLIALSVFILIGKRHYGLLIASGLILLNDIVILFRQFVFVNLLSVVAWAAVCLLLWFVITEKESPHMVIQYLPAGIFLALSLFDLIHLFRVPQLKYIFFVDLFNAISFFCLGKAAVRSPNFAFDRSLNNNLYSKETPPPLPQAFGAANQFEKKVKSPGVLLVRYNIDKLNELGGSYGFQSGKLIAQAVPANLMEGMSISDGDSAATLAGREYVCVVSIAHNDIDFLRNRIEPLIRASKEIQENGADPVVQVVSSTREPLVLDGVVSSGKIVGGGGWCASGFMQAWKEAAENAENLPEDINRIPNVPQIEGGGTIRAASPYQAKPVINHGQDIVSILFSLLLIIGGASGQFVLRGTSSSSALVLAGIAFLGWDLYSVVKKRTALSKYEQEKSTQAEKMRREEQAVMTESQALSKPVNIRITCDGFLAALNLGARLNGSAMTWDASTSEFIGSTSNVRNIITFENVDLVAVFDIASSYEDVVIELFHDMNGIGMQLPNQAIILPRE